MLSDKHSMRADSLLRQLDDKVRPSGVFDLQKYTDSLRSSELPTACKRLALLYDLCLDIYAEMDLQGIYNKILSAVRTTFTLERAFIAITSGQRLIIKADHGIDLSDDPQDWPVSKTMLNRVLQEGICIRTTDAKHDTTYNKAQSVDLHNIRSVMCCPIGSVSDHIGLIYVDNTLKSGVFTGDDLLYLDLLSHYAAFAVKNAQERTYLTEQRELAETRLAVMLDEMYGQYNIVGTSREMLSLYSQAKKVATKNVSVLLDGETGTGKEFLARFIHANSARKDKPFVAINVGALPRTLVESELFGHEKGAFTGAEKKYLGRFDLADKGTLFLDEIQDIPLEVQPKLLRFLEQRTFERLGCSESRFADVRVISASNKDLEKCIEEGTFREDLYYRLNTVALSIPALRKRTEDVRPLAAHFLQQIGSKKILREDVLDYLENYSWPGNIRELKNCIEAIDALVDESIVHVRDLPGRMRKSPSLRGSTSSFEPLDAVIERVEREHYVKALEATGGNCGKAIGLLKVARSTFFQRKKDFGL
jgi:Nif-specific regulatory protein